MSDQTSALFRYFNRPLTCVALLILSLLVTPAFAACESDASRAFDFWLGEWQVHTPVGNWAGTNHIQPAYGGCVLTEHYANKGGPYGTSVNIFDASRGLWHQTWVDKSGLLLQLEGGPDPTNEFPNMTMEGTTVGKGGTTIMHRITWIKRADDSVSQHWQTRSADAEWQTLFLGIYTRSSAQQESSINGH